MIAPCAATARLATCGERFAHVTVLARGRTLNRRVSPAKTGTVN
jgi:hypothetical protein